MEGVSLDAPLNRTEPLQISSEGIRNNLKQTGITMAGVGKLLKQAQKMQKQMEAIQASLAAMEIDVTSGGGAVAVKISGQGEFRALKLDPEFLKEEASFVEETILDAIKEAAAKAKTVSEAEMGKATAGLSLPGMF